MPLIPLGDIELHVRDEGRGPPLLLVHGFPLDHTMWREQIEFFAAAHRVIAPDLRGFGRSHVTAGTVTMQQHADDLARLLTALDVAEPICFCGLSMGGYIAFPFVQRHRTRLRSLILCDTRAAPDAPEARQNRHGLAKKVIEQGAGFIAETMPEKLFAQHTWTHRPELIAEVQAVIRNTPAEGIAAAARGMAERADSRPLLSKIDVPSLLIVGEEDGITPPDEMRAMADALPNATYASIPRAGHMSPLEQPEPVNAAIAQFLATAGAADNR